MPYGSMLADTLQGSVALTPTVFKDGNSTEIGQLCRSWCYFTGSSGVTTRSFNISSITVATGNWTVNYTNAFSGGPCVVNAADAGSNVIGPYSSSSATTSVNIQTKNTGGSNINTGSIHSAAFG